MKKLPIGLNSLKNIIRDEFLYVDKTKKIYELCAACHEANGWGKEDGSFPVIAGQHRSVIIKQLADIRARNRENPTMYPFSGDDVLGGPQGIGDVAEYISQLPPNPSVGIGPGEDLDKGKKIFEENCAACHGKNGEGNAEAFYPRIQGQHYAYILRQLKWIRDGRRVDGQWGRLAGSESEGEPACVQDLDGEAPADLHLDVVEGRVGSGPAVRRPVAHGVRAVLVQ